MGKWLILAICIFENYTIKIQLFFLNHINIDLTSQPFLGRWKIPDMNLKY